MARAAEPNLALAATRPGGDEDTLTEIFAGVMSADQRLARDVLALACGHGIEPASAVTVETQCTVRGTGKLDMWLEAESASCWIENKLDAEFGRDQLERYSALGMGLVILPEVRRADVPTNEGWRVATWREIARTARSLLDADGVDLIVAREPTATARHKALADLISYLQERHIVPRPDPPLSAQDDDALAKASYVLGTAVPCLLDAVRHRAEASGLHTKDTRPPGASHRDYGYVVFQPEQHGWADQVGGLYEARVDGNPDFADHPALGVGLTVYENPAKSSSQRVFAGNVWRNELEIARFDQLRVKLGWRVFRLFRPHELPGKFLADQANSAADEFMRAHDDLTRLERTWQRWAGEGSVDA